METIHLKTVDPFSQELLRSAAHRGIKLNWDRYEKLQPQDGFLRLGLSCPFGCMQGPCRIDPFGRGPDRGVCGLDRDSMVAAILLRICLQGVLEVMAADPAAGMIPTVSFPAPLDSMAAKSLENFSGHTLSTMDIIKSAGLLRRPTEPPERLVKQALHLSLLAIGLLGQDYEHKITGARSLQAGYGVVDTTKMNIGFAGRPSPEFLDALRQEAATASAFPVQFISLGAWILQGDGFMPIACSSGEAELLLSSGAVSLLAAGPEADPGVLELARSLGIPLVVQPNAAEAGEVLQLARQFHSTAPTSDLRFDPGLKGEGAVIMSPGELETKINAAGESNVVLVGGSDNLQQPLGYLPVEIATAFRGEGYQVAGWGDAALWMIKNGYASKENDLPVHILDNHQGPLLALKALAAAAKIDALKGICYTGIKDCRDLSAALGLAVLGCNVCIATPIPLWGSSRICDLLAEMLTPGGGNLTHFDHPAEARDILDWLATFHP